jgi:hypothetical protein
MKVVLNQEYTTEGKENLMFMTDTSVGELCLWVLDGVMMMLKKKKTQIHQQGANNLSFYKDIIHIFTHTYTHYSRMS